MTVRFYQLAVLNVQPETNDSTSITFAVPEELRPVFQYKQGQYITVKVDVGGVSHRRNYSLCSSPYYDEPLRIGVKRVQDGIVSSWLTEHLTPGTTVEVYPPMGNFTRELTPTASRHYVMFAGGSGITPVLSILKSILRVEPQSVITLVYANRNVASIMFDAEIENLKASHPNNLRIVHVVNEGTDKTSYHGVPDAPMVARVLADWVPVVETSEFFVCGPSGMMTNVIETLKSRGVDDRHIHREYFTIDSTSNSSSTMNSLESDTPEAITTHNVTIRMYGQEFTFDVEPEETILTAALRANLDPPFACQIGACCTCRAKLLTGKVKMDEREALSDDEIDEGYVLTCQSHPLTENVVVDYDL